MSLVNIVIPIGPVVLGDFNTCGLIALAVSMYLVSISVYCLVAVSLYSAYDIVCIFTS